MRWWPGCDTAVAAGASDCTEGAKRKAQMLLKLPRKDNLISKQALDVALSIERETHTHSFCCSEAGLIWVAQHVASLIKYQCQAASGSSKVLGRMLAEEVAASESEDEVLQEDEDGSSDATGEDGNEV
ncbi:hypothetical protein NE237_009617 [Protea cynaroides]|uniref:Uncharacterized protein n=1 Tax=Protea cynaroides TaxID=273540 RepID=A0A9Q0R0T5_9MAGN|nr:hypothetical protein NE237_009617 [Protea cynaroides]